MAARAPARLSLRTTGSTCLHPLSELLGIPLDQVNFVVCQLFALCSAFWFRIYLHPGKASCEVRHALATILGIYFVVFCFGWYSVHLFVLVLMCYGVMVTANVSNIHRYSFFVAMGYLTICHISRIYIFKYGIFTTDFSGPLMIVTQKITTLAFQVHDGLGRRAEDLSPEQHRLAIKVKPSFLEYSSYLLNFMSVIAGPCNNFKDYIAFIEGRHIHMKLLEVNWKQRGFHSLPEPSSTVRSNFRHHFLSSKALKLVYDVVTWATTQLAVSYIAAPFVLLAVEPTISLYNLLK